MPRTLKPIPPAYPRRISSRLPRDRQGYRSPASSSRSSLATFNYTVVAAALPRIVAELEIMEGHRFRKEKKRDRRRLLCTQRHAQRSDPDPAYGCAADEGLTVGKNERNSRVRNPASAGRGRDHNEVQNCLCEESASSD